MRSLLAADFSQTVFPVVALGILQMTDMFISTARCSEVPIYSQTLDVAIEICVGSSISWIKSEYTQNSRADRPC